LTSPKSAAPGAQKTLVNLQICRAFAAAMVVYAHSLQEANVIAQRSNTAGLEAGVDWGFGVHLFFVISGFIMVYISAREFAAPGAAGLFFVRRLMRIVPLYWLLTTVMLLGALAAPQLLNVPVGNGLHILKSYLFIPDWRPDLSSMRPVLALGWTLNYEMLFYFVFALALNFRMARGIAFLTILLLGAVLAHVTLGLEGVLGFWTDPLVLEFVLGAYLGLIYRTRAALSGPLALVLAAAGVLALTLHFETLGQLAGIRELVFGIPALMIVAAATLGPELPESFLTRWGVRVGDASYALYLVHPFVLRPVRNLWLEAGLASLPLELYCWLCVLSAIVAALMLNAVFEKPVTRLLHGFARKPAKQSGPPGAQSLAVGRSRH
jgi:peptidoglycan/LPS O-acetylase OafA/YrhL